MSHWRFIALSCTIAGALTLGYCMLTPPRYTATASILIEAPAGNDPRIATSVSPVYLESLKTYEVLAGNDTMFLQAVNRFNLRSTNSEKTIEALKARVLKVTKLRDTKVMQISVTLKSPADAQAMARFLAEETVKLSDSITTTTGSNLIDEARRQTAESKAALEQAQAALSKVATTQPIDSLKTELNSMIELQYRMKRSQAEAETDAAEYASRAGAATATEKDADARMTASMRARAEQAQKQAAALETRITAATRQLAERTSRLQQLSTSVQAAQKTYDIDSKRAQDLTSALGMSEERLRIIDVGAVPERPSEPRTVLLTGAAIGIGLLASLSVLSFQFGLRR